LKNFSNQTVDGPHSIFLWKPMGIHQLFFFFRVQQTGFKHEGE